MVYSMAKMTSVCLKQIWMKLIERNDSDDHSTPGHEGETDANNALLHQMQKLLATLGKWLAIDFQMLLCVEWSLPVKKLCILDIEGLNEEQPNLCLAEEKTTTCQLSKSAVLTLKIVCILMVSVVLFCICTVSMSKTIVAEKLNVRTRVKKYEMPLFFLLSHLWHLGHS